MKQLVQQGMSPENAWLFLSSITRDDDKDDDKD